jgi:hypothetical protein
VAVDRSLELRCELTPEKLDRAAPELALALADWASRRQEAMRLPRQRLEPWLRGLGLALAALGAILSGGMVALLPERTCAGAACSGLLYQVMTPLFVVLGVVFWFLPGLSAALRAWAIRTAAARAPRLLAPLRAASPTRVDYRLAGGRLESRLARPPRTASTPLAALGGALVGAEVACLFGRAPLARLLRVVWLAGPVERAALTAALQAAGVPVTPLPAGLSGASPAPGAPAPPPRRPG